MIFFKYFEFRLGYDTPSQPSPGCAPTSPSCMLGDKECSNSSADNTPTSDQVSDVEFPEFCVVMYESVEM